MGTLLINLGEHTPTLKFENVSFPQRKDGCWLEFDEDVWNFQGKAVRHVIALSQIVAYCYDPGEPTQEDRDRAQENLIREQRWLEAAMRKEANANSSSEILYQR